MTVENVPSDPSRAHVSSVTLADLAFAVPIVSADAPVSEVDRLFRRDRTLRGVIVRSASGVTLLSREQLDFELSGPFGYGRSLHARSRVADVAVHGDVVLPGHATLSEAANVLLSRPAEQRYRDALVDDAGNLKVVGVSAVFAELAAIFRHVSLHDPLTGLPNRRLLDECGLALARTQMPASRIAMLYIDLDGFKVVNDSFGHKAGDEVLAHLRRTAAFVCPPGRRRGPARGRRVRGTAGRCQRSASAGDRGPHCVNGLRAVRLRRSTALPVGVGGLRDGR